MALALPYTIVNGDPVDANPVQSNYRMIESYTNQEVIDRAGTVAMTAQLKLVGNPVAALDAAPKQYVDQQLPIGVVMMYGGTTSPPGGIWLLCDGTEYQATTYPELAVVMGATAGRFNVPALVDRLPIGGGAAYSHHTTGGSADAQLLVHSHTINHDHGNVTSTDTNHYHDLGGTTGASDRPLSTSNDGNHQHAVPVGGSRGFIVDGVSGTEAGIQIGGSGYSITPFDSVAGAHTHAVTDHLHPLPANTAWMKQNSVHAHTVPALNGSSGQAGSLAAGAGANLPPYYAIAFIIKAK